MEVEISKENMNIVKEMVLDEERLVTYATLSKELLIHVNVSKSLLKAVVDDIRQNLPKTELSISHVISGLSRDHQARTTVCLESELQAVKDAMETVFFNHIYSVCKGTPKVDNVALMAVNKFEDFPLCVGLIKGNSCVKRSLEEIGSLKTTSHDVASTSQPQKTKSAPIMKKPVKTTEESTNVKVAEPSQVKSEPIIKKEIVSPKKDVSQTNKVKSEPKGKPQKGIAGFFSKQNGNTSKKTVEPVKQTIKEEIKSNGSVKSNAEEVVTAVKEEEMEVDIDIPAPVTKSNTKESASSSSSLKNGVGTNKSKPQAKNKPVSQVKKNAKVDKKRKRVLKVSDSESEEDKDPFADDTPTEIHESDDEIPPTPTINTVKITSGIINPRKRRKIVDKTFTDEEGYILTKKVEVYESCSDNEEEGEKKENVQTNQLKKEIVVKEVKETSPKQNKKEAKNSKKKISPPQKGKQATMMSFFKKV
ncbi:unnamed protein product [Plutella xylostella]|uniref:DNA polymerase delta subunit 3 n=1 Tax=Plutella xylostella TaxID=51655 RepID=A0A8S4EY99_PLUXY|nr:unnamed protein product [Plutella xylostella]